MESDRPLIEGRIFEPVINPLNPNLVGYERQAGNTRTLVFLDLNRRRAFPVGGIQPERAVEEVDPMAFNLTDQREEEIPAQFAGDLDWRPVLDTQGRQWFVYASSEGGSDGFDLHFSYFDEAGNISTEPPFRISSGGVVRFPRWSPDGLALVYTEGTELRLSTSVMAAVQSADPTRFISRVLVQRAGGVFYPAWAPDGAAVAYQAEATEQQQENMGIEVVNLTPRSYDSQGQPVRVTSQLNDFHEFRPSWSPDGEYIAFDVSRDPIRFDNESDLLDIGVIRVQRAPGERRIFRGEQQGGMTRRIAENVLPSSNRGTGWALVGGDSGQQQLLFTLRDPDRGFPIAVATLEGWLERRPSSDFRRDISVEANFGTVNHLYPSTALTTTGRRFVFVSQEEGTQRVQVRDVGGARVATPLVPMERSRNSALVRSAIVPGWGQMHKGNRGRGLIFMAAQAATVGATAYFGLRHGGLEDKFTDADTLYKKFAESPPDGSRATADTMMARLTAAEAAWEDGRKNSDRIRVAALSAGIVWGLSLVDSALGFPRWIQVSPPGYRMSAGLSPVAVPSEGFRPSPGVGLTLQFVRKRGGGR